MISLNLEYAVRRKGKFFSSAAKIKPNNRQEAHKRAPVVTNLAMKVSPKAILLVLNLFGDVAKQAASNDSNEFSGETNKEALNLDVESSKDRQSGVLESDRSLLDECSDVPGWQDADGFTCSWYGSFGGVECTISGDSHAGSGGLTANEACEFFILFLFLTTFRLSFTDIILLLCWLKRLCL